MSKNSLNIYKNDLIQVCSAVKDNFVQFSAGVRLTRNLELKTVYIPLELENFHLPNTVFGEDIIILENRIKRVESWISDYLSNPSASKTLQPAAKQSVTAQGGDFGKRVMIVAEPGAGKSTLLNRICLAYLNYENDEQERLFLSELRVKEEAVLSQKALLPILIPARTLIAFRSEELNSDLASLSYRCFIQLTDSALSFEEYTSIVKRKACNGEIIVIIDGYDELYQPEKEIVVLDALTAFTKDYPKCDIIFSTRQLNQFPIQFKPYKAIGIKHLDEKAIDSFCKQWCRLALNDEKLSESISETIVNSNDTTISQLRRLPLTLSHLLTVFSVEDGIPSNKAVLYERLCKWYIRWNKRRKGITLKISTTQILLSYIAFAFTRSGWLSCTKEELYQILSDAIKDLRYDLEEHLATEEINNYIWQLENLAVFGKLGDNYCFLMHRQVQEYLTALAICKNYTDEKFKYRSPNEIFNDKYASDFWHEVIVFFILICEDKEKKDSVINDIILLAHNDEDNTAYESLLLDILSNNVRSIKINEILAVLFSESINQNKIYFLYQLSLSENVIYYETIEYLTNRLKSDIEDNIIEDENYHFGIGFALGVLEASRELKKNANPLEVAENNLSSTDKKDEFIAKMILNIMLWVKCNDIRTPFSESLKAYTFHSFQTLRNLIKTIKNDYASSDLLQEFILSDELDATELFDEETILTFLNAISTEKKLSRAQMEVLSVIPFESISSITLTESAKSNLFHSMETVDHNNNLRKLIYWFSACYKANCFEKRYELLNRFTNIVNKYAYSTLCEQVNLCRILKKQIPLLYHYKSGNNGSHYVAAYYNEIPEEAKLRVSVSKNNLAYLLRRKVIEAVYYVNEAVGNAEKMSIDTLLQEGIAAGEAFPIINYALYLSNICKNDYGNAFIGLDFIITHPIEKDLSAAISWWESLAFDQDEIEGKIVLSWLFDAKYFPILKNDKVFAISTTEIMDILENGQLDDTNKANNHSFTVTNEEGVEIECDVLFTYTDEVTGKTYIAYTDNSLDEDGDVKVFASIIDPNSENPVLQEIENEEDWNIIEKLLGELNQS